MDNFYETTIAPALREALDTYGLEATDDQIGLLLRHLDLVITKNKVLNLTRITNPEEAVYLHVVDSLLPLKTGLFSHKTSFVDIGTGAGYPGIPLGIVSGASGLLIDSVAKKVAAVSEFIDELDLTSSLSARAVRAEDLARTKSSSFDVVIARAVAQTNTLIEYAAPLLKSQGSLVVCKSNPTDEELSLANNAASICGMANVSRETFELPQGLGHREILTYKKVSKPKIKLPRRTGLAKHSPLGVTL